MAAAALTEACGIAADALPDALLRSDQPVLLRGLVAHWPAVAAARASRAEAEGYLRRFWQGARVGVWWGPPEIHGRFFYNADFTGFNFRRELMTLASVLDALDLHARSPAPPALYVGSTTVDTCLPGFRQENDVGMAPRQPLMSLWLGNRTRIAAHQDLPANLACVVAGRRRFTLFAPEELPNLYVGPLDFTPAGQAISLVDFHHPDLQRHPRFAQALARAVTVELGPGDALLLPSLWWHHVEALDDFNLLVNYWWRDAPARMDSPFHALQLALLTMRDLPAPQRQVWQEIFRHYVFEPGADTAAHIPPAARGVLAPLTDDTARQLRAQLLKALNR